MSSEAMGSDIRGNLGGLVDVAASSRRFLMPVEGRVGLVPNGAWKYFFFGERGNFSQSEFTFRLETRGRLTVADYLCEGDRFEVFNGTQRLGVTGEPRWTQPSTRRPCRGEFTVPSPDAALHNERYSTGVFDLLPGDYVIRIRPDASLGAGLAAVRVDANEWCELGSRFRLFRGATCPGAAAEAACRSFGPQWVVARVTWANWLEAERTIRLCLRPLASAIVASWNGDRYVAAQCGIKMTARPVQPLEPEVGAITENHYCTHYPVLCERDDSGGC